MKKALKTAGITLGIVGAGFGTAYATNDTVKEYSNELRADLKDKSELVYEIAERKVVDVFNIEKEEKTEENDTTTTQKTPKKDFFVVKDPKTGKTIATSDQKLEGGDDKLNKQIQTIIDKYQSSKHPKVQAVLSGLKTISKQNILTETRINGTVNDITLRMMNPNTILKAKDMQYLSFCKDLNKEIPTLKLNIDSKQFVAKILKSQATRKTLNSLKTNKTFAANFNDARNLKGKKNELTKGGKSLDKDGKVMLSMEEYFWFKEHTSGRDIKDMRNFLMFMTGDISYRNSDKLTDEFVVGEYLTAMEKMENDMKNTAKLSPSYKNIVEVDDDDL